MRNRTHLVAADLEAADAPGPEPAHERQAEIVMAIDGAHIHAARGYQSRHIDVMVGKFALPEFAGVSVSITSRVDPVRQFENDVDVMARPTVVRDRGVAVVHSISHARRRRPR